MSDFISLTCPKCGAKLQVENGVEQFACAHCGTEHLVKRGGGTISIAPIVEQLQSVNKGVDKTASELAIKRLRDEIREIKASMPTEKEGCLSKVGYPLAGFGLLVGIGGLMTGDGGTILGAILSAAAMIAIGVWMTIMEDKNHESKMKPYWDAVEKRQSEIEQHMKVLKLDSK